MIKLGFTCVSTKRNCVTKDIRKLPTFNQVKIARNYCKIYNFLHIQWKKRIAFYVIHKHKQIEQSEYK